MAEQYFVGIDLGTTYSCLACIDEDGNPAVVKNFEEEDTTPSVILFNENGEIIVGAPAKDMAIMYPADRIVTGVKRLIGTDKTFEIDGNEYTPITLSAAILRKMINDFNDKFKCDLKRAVITCPAYFGNNERDATKTAGTVAGLDEVTIINEPTAAAISFGFGTDGTKKRVLVYDLGGGTFDVTVLEIEGKNFTAVATDGQRLLGGKDWDAALTKIIIDKVSEASGMDREEIEADDDIRQTLQLDSETLKKRLSTAESTKGTITVGGKKIVYTVTRTEFETATAGLIQSTVELIDKVLSAKNFTVADLDAVLLVGGSSRMPQVQKAILSHFPDAKIQVFDPDQSVAKGAAIYCKSFYGEQSDEERRKAADEARKATAAAALKQQQADEARKAAEALAASGAAATEVQAQQEAAQTAAAAALDAQDAALTAAKAAADANSEPLNVHNVLSKSFGVQISDDDGTEYISNIIFRNETLPISAEKTYYPMEDGQISINVRICEDAAENNEKGQRVPLVEGTEVGGFEMELPENVSKDTPVVVHFTATDEGILTATVDCSETHHEYQLQNELQMSDSEIEKSQGLMDKVSTGTQ
ncbi:MAG: Hsp70 family protein [Methanomethylophilus sp.]